MLSWLSLNGVNAKSNQLETFEHFKARLSLQPPPPPQSSVRQNESLSQVGRRAGSTHGGKIGKPVLKSSDGPATKTPRPVPEVKEQPVSKDSLQTIIALLQTHSLLLFMCGDTCIFQLQWDNFISFFHKICHKLFKRIPAGGAMVAPGCGLIIHSHSGTET